MAEQVLYKYRSLDNWKFLIDIFCEKRLFAAPFRALNDPMEGRYYYYGDDVTRAFKRAVRESKDYWRICSLSKSARNTLMWSYYGGGHTGVAVGVIVPKRRGQRKVGVTYDMQVGIGPHDLTRDPREVALGILSQKQLNWSHEQEFRVFSNHEFVPVKIKEIVLGCQAKPEDQRLVKKLVSAVVPGAVVKKLNRTHLDSPIDGFA